MPLIKLNATLGLTGTLPAVSGANLTGVSAGKILQVVHGITTTEVSHLSNGSQVDTGLTATITPSATSSKILVLISQSNKVERGSAVLLNYELRLLRDSTTIEYWDSVCAEEVQNGGSKYGSNHAYHYQDTPSSTSSLVYKTTGRIVSNGGGRTVIFQDASAPSTITLMEIEG